MAPQIPPDLIPDLVTDVVPDSGTDSQIYLFKFTFWGFLNLSGGILGQIAFPPDYGFAFG